MNTIPRIIAVIQVENTLEKVIYVYYFNLQKYSETPLNSIEECGIDAKFVNTVYDTLFQAVSQLLFAFCFVILYKTL